MKNTRIFLALAAAGMIGAGGYGLYQLGAEHGAKTATSTADAVDPVIARKVLYWHDPMVPGQKFDKPGKSPFMDMQLVPVYADDAGDEGTVSISSRVQQNLGIRTAEVVKESLASSVEAVGSVAYNERDLEVVQARSNGFMEQLYVRAPLDPVKKGQPLAQLYVPDWVAAQEEYLSIRRMGSGAGTEGLLDAARQRMRLAGMTDDLIRLVESTGKVHTRLTITAPIGGVVAELGAREGMTVMAGAPLFRINGLRTVWLNAEVPENAAARLRPGNPVEARTPALPDTVFQGKVGAILPEVNATTRTIKVRIELANSSRQLVPGMFVTVSLSPAARKDVLLVPSEAVIQTGKRSVVMVAQGEGRFLPVEVETGDEADGKTEIRKGLEAGQKVVVSGQFLIDSEASLKGTETRLTGMSATDNHKTAGAPMHHAVGKIEKIDKDGITISHGPIPSLQWGAMTMGFKPPAAGLPPDIAVGDSVAFDLRPTADGMFEIAAIKKTEQLGVVK
jgi:membrane fusion protein, copper/silver efflux system